MAKKIDENDFWYIADNVVTKAGVFPYMGKEISPELKENEVYYVYRPEEELNSLETLESLKLLPFINDHEMLGENFTPAEEKGVDGVIGDNVYYKDGKVYADLKIFSESMKNDIESGKKELSLGYLCNYELTSGEFDGCKYDAVQKNIRGNHIALVAEGRTGPEARVMDRNVTFDTIEELRDSFAKNDQDYGFENDFEKIEDIIAQAVNAAVRENDEFEGGVDEKENVLRQILQKIKIADDDNETPTEDEEGEDFDLDDIDSMKVANDTIDAIPQQVMMAISERDNLAKDIIPYVGTFDYSSMTSAAVAKYACGKLGLSAKQGFERAALDGYIKGAGRNESITYSLKPNFITNDDVAFNEYITKGS